MSGLESASKSLSPFGSTFRISTWFFSHLGFCCDCSGSQKYTFARGLAFLECSIRSGSENSLPLSQRNIGKTFGNSSPHSDSSMSMAVCGGDGLRRGAPGRGQTGDPHDPVQAHQLPAHAPPRGEDLQERGHSLCCSVSFSKSSYVRPTRASLGMPRSCPPPFLRFLYLTFLGRWMFETSSMRPSST